MALKGNWYAVAPAAWVAGFRLPFVGTLVTAGLVGATIADAADSSEPSPLLVAAATAAVTDWLIWQ